MCQPSQGCSANGTSPRLSWHARESLAPRVMRALRELIEKRPKNVSFSEDNGYWMPTGSRLEFKDLSPGPQCPLTGGTGGAGSGPGLSGRSGTSPGRGYGWQMKKASLRATFIFGRRLNDRSWQQSTSVRQRLTKMRSMQALKMSSQEGSTLLSP